MPRYTALRPNYRKQLTARPVHQLSIDATGESTTATITAARQVEADAESASENEDNTDDAYPTEAENWGCAPRSDDEQSPECSDEDDEEEDDDKHEGIMSEAENWGCAPRSGDEQSPYCSDNNDEEDDDDKRPPRIFVGDWLGPRNDDEQDVDSLGAEERSNKKQKYTQVQLSEDVGSRRDETDSK